MKFIDKILNFFKKTVPLTKEEVINLYIGKKWLEENIELTYEEVEPLVQTIRDGKKITYYIPSSKSTMGSTGSVYVNGTVSGAPVFKFSGYVPSFSPPRILPFPPDDLKDWFIDHSRNKFVNKITGEEKKISNGIRSLVGF